MRKKQGRSDERSEPRVATATKKDLEAHTEKQMLVISTMRLWRG